MDKSKLPTHQVSIADLLIQALVVELDDPVDRVTEHCLQLNGLVLGVNTLGH